MLVITIGKGSAKFQADWGGPVLTVGWPSKKYRLPCVKYALEPRDKPDCEEFYNKLKAEGLTPEQIIDEMIEMYIPFRLFSVGMFSNIQLMLGIIGRRGAGKSASATFIIIFDYLIRNRPVFSNNDIEVKVRYRDCEKVFTSRPWTGIDGILELPDSNNGVIFIDEINLSVASSGLYMSTANREFTDQIQQMRKKDISIIWTAQKWSTVDSRVLWQSDFIIQAEDAWHRKKYKPICVGDKTLWEVMDISGMTGVYDAKYENSHRYIQDFHVWSGYQWIRPIWSAYDTKQAQSGHYHVEYRENEAKKYAKQKDITYEVKQQTHKQIVTEIMEHGIKKIYADQLYSTLDNSQQYYNKKELGTALNEYYQRGRDKAAGKDGKRRYYYEIRPEKAHLLANTEEIGGEQ